jgi:hypothetical protein
VSNDPGSGTATGGINACVFQPSCPVARPIVCCLQREGIAGCLGAVTWRAHPLPVPGICMNR